MIILKTLTGNLAANVNEMSFTDNIINNNSIIEVYYNNNDVYTVETWQRENTIGIVTNDHDFPVGVKVLINNVVAFEPYDDSDLVNQIDSLDDRIGDAEDAISALATRVGHSENDIVSLDSRLDNVEDDIDTLDTSKQDVLIPGDNITIVDNTISASGAGINYSTAEQDTGIKWVNNKPVYQKTYTNLSINVTSNGAWVNSNIDISFVDKLLSCSLSGDIFVWNIINGFKYNNNLYLTTGIVAGNVNFSINEITIMYTKL